MFVKNKDKVVNIGNCTSLKIMDSNSVVVFNANGREMLGTFGSPVKVVDAICKGIGEGKAIIDVSDI